MKNVQNIMAKNLIVVTVGFPCWFTFGYAIALGEGENGFMGTTGFFTIGFDDAKANFKVWFFQGAFCATGATIVSGAMAERTQLKGFVAYVLVMTSFIYPAVAYWGWSGAGFLNKDGKSPVGPGLMDFAGSGIVHMVGGVAALCGAIIVGPRKDRWTASGDDFSANNVPYVVVGTFFLWFGWYGFNPGSTLELHTVAKAHEAGIVAVNTTLAPSVAGIVVFSMRFLQQKKLDVCAYCNGILAGLVSITAGCGAVRPWESCVIGLIGAFFYEGSSQALKRLKVDDIVDAFPIHGVCGCWGVIATGLFGDASTGGNGAFYGGDQLGTQIVAVIIIAAWTATISCAVFVPLKLAGALRLGDNFQDEGADKMEHSPPKAYESGAATQWAEPIKMPESTSV